MSVHSSWSSSQSGDTVSVPSSAGLKNLYDDSSRYHDTCTFVGPNNGAREGCYVYRSCKSCLEIDGCLVNDYGICVSQYQGMYVLKDEAYAYNTAYNPSMNYLEASSRGLVVVPNATTNNADALAYEQNWHFRAGEAKYCKASDPVCKECKAQNFWRSAVDEDTLPDSRFCVGQDGCVCIQTCEVPTYKTPGCQWKLSTYGNNYNGGGYYGDSEVERISSWEWLLIVVLILAVPPLLRALTCACRDDGERQKRLHDAAKLAVRQELGIADDPAPQPVPVARPRPRRQETVLTEDSLTPRSIRDEDLQVFSPHPGFDTTTVFIELEEDRRSTHGTTTA